MASSPTVVQIEGVGNVQFPEGMTDEQVNTAAKKLYTDAAAKKIADNPPGMPQAPKPDMKPSYLAMAVANTPSNADPHNPGNINPEILNQMDPETRADAEKTLATTAATTLPLMGAIPAGKAAYTALTTPEYLGGTSMVEKGMELLTKAAPHLRALEALGLGAGGVTFVVKELMELFGGKK